MNLPQGIHSLLSGRPPASAGHDAGHVQLHDIFGKRAFTRAEALEAGLTRAQWQTLVASGKLTKFRRGVYALQEAGDDRQQHAQQVSAALAGRSRHFACSGSAVALHGLPNPYFTWWSRTPVTIAGPKSRPQKQIRRLRRAPIETPWGLSTDLLDTAATIAAELPLPQALMVTDAVAQRLAGTEDRFVLASRRCRTEVRRQLLEVVDLPALRLADPAADSPAESFFRGHLLIAGFPEPRCGVSMKGASGDQYFIDMVLEGLLLEVDGRKKYKNLQVLIDEKNREDDLRATGRDFKRTFVEDLYSHPASEVAQVSDRLRLALPA